MPASTTAATETRLSAPEGALTVAARSPGTEVGPLLSVIVPTFNEAPNIAPLLGRLTRLLQPRFNDRYEIIVVDDNSPDRTWELAENLSAEIPQLRVMRRQSESGLATAVIRGWQVARAEVLCVMDADLQHPPEIVAELYEVIERGADLAVASRHVEGGGVSDWSVLRRIVSRTAQLIGLLILPGTVGRISDPMSGYFMIRRSAIEGVELNPLGYKILLEVLARGRFHWIGEIPYVFNERAHGGSKATAAVYAAYLRHLLRLRFATLPINRFVRFAAVGLSGVVVDMSLLYILSDPSMLGWGLTRSKLVAAETAIVNNFLWNDLWTFGDLSGRQRGWRLRLRRFGSFQLICLAGVILNTLFLNIQFNVLHINRYVANAVSIALVTGWNFWLNAKLSWGVADPAAATRRETPRADRSAR
jgi:dolichol-phosphate mannosyltransferase